MAYVAARGGEAAITYAEQLHQLLHAPLSREAIDLIEVEDAFFDPIRELR